MRRRAVVRNAGVMLTLAFAGCSDGGGTDNGDDGLPTPPPETTQDGMTFTTPPETPDPAPNLSIDTFRIDRTDEDELLVVVSVTNVAGSESTAELVVLVRAGTSEFERKRTVTVPGDSTVTYEFQFPVTETSFRNDGSLDFEWREGPDGE